MRFLVRQLRGNGEWSLRPDTQSTSRRSVLGSRMALRQVSISLLVRWGIRALGHSGIFLQARKPRHVGIRLSGRFAQVKEETAQQAGDTEQNVQAA